MFSDVTSFFRWRLEKSSAKFEKIFFYWKILEYKKSLTVSRIIKKYTKKILEKIADNSFAYFSI